MIELIKIAVSLIPVFIFLAALIFLDSFKLVSLRSVVHTIIIGCFIAVVCLFLNSWLLEFLSVNKSLFSNYVSPVTEELLKAGYLIYLIRTRKVGFMVDSAIYGFAIGAGFAFFENIHYLLTLQSSNLLLWIVRGFGTAIMHGGTMAVFGIISKNLSDRKSSDKFLIFIPGLMIAVITHSIFNHFIFSPELSTVVIVILLPLLIIVVFDQSEKATRNWLGMGIDADMELLEVITTGQIKETRVGVYLESLKSRFPGVVVADMLCLLRIHLELALRAKGLLLMREAGFMAASDPEVKEKFKELKYLEKSIGKTGKLAILPFLHTSSQDLWQIHMLNR